MRNPASGHRYVVAVEQSGNEGRLKNLTLTHPDDGGSIQTFAIRGARPMVGLVSFNGSNEWAAEDQIDRYNLSGVESKSYETSDEAFWAVQEILNPGGF